MFYNVWIIEWFREVEYRVCIYIVAEGSRGETTKKEMGKSPKINLTGQREICEMIGCQSTRVAHTTLNFTCWRVI